MVANSLDGVLTERLVGQGEIVRPGDRLYSVDLVPVVAVSGRVPAFRELRRDVEGADVRQLQEALITAGIRSAPADGKFGARTVQEVREWQEQVGLPSTGDVPLGQVVFVPGLPGVVDWVEEGAIGSHVGPGTEVAAVLSSKARFDLTIPEDQLRLVEPGMTVEIDSGPKELTGVIGQIVTSDDVTSGTATARIEAADGRKSVCDTWYEDVAVGGDQIVPARVVVTPPTTGTTVPAAAIAVGGQGTTVVTLEDGTVVDVTVDAVVGGEAVVGGIDPGTRMRVPVGQGTSNRAPVSGSAAP